MLQRHGEGQFSLIRQIFNKRIVALNAGCCLRGYQVAEMSAALRRTAEGRQTTSTGTELVFRWVNVTRDRLSY